MWGMITVATIMIIIIIIMRRGRKIFLPPSDFDRDALSNDVSGNAFASKNLFEL